MTAYSAENVAEMYVATFAGRRDCYQLFPAGAPHWQPHREPLTAAVVLAARESATPLGVYFLGASGETHVAAVDVDDEWSKALAIARALRAAGVLAYAEPSRRGGHVWTVLDAVMPAIVIRRALRAACQLAGIADDDEKVELRPGQDRLGDPDGLGSALRGPMQPHPKTGEVHPLVDPETELPLHQKVGGMLLTLDWTSSANLAALAERCHLPEIAAPSPAAPFPGDSMIDTFNQIGVSAVLARDWGALNAQPGRSIRCPAHEDRSPSLSIARDDSRAWCHSPACDLHGPNGAGHDAFSLWTLAQAVTS